MASDGTMSHSRVSCERHQAALAGATSVHPNAAFRRAIDLDPSFAAAYSGLSDCYAGMGTVSIGESPSELRPRARAAAKQALELDASLAEAHASLATVQLFDWEWEAAERSFVRAIEASPGNSTAHARYALLLVAQRRFDQAIAEARLAETLDPLSPLVVTNTAYVLILARQPDAARQKLETALRLDPQYMTARWRLGSLHAQNGRYEEAIAILAPPTEGPRPSHLFVAYLAYAYGRAGKRDDAERLTRRLLHASAERYVSPSLMAVAYLGAGDRDRMFEWLERAYEERSNFMAFLDIFPYFDAVREDPRFSDLLQRVMPTPLRSSR